jgi:hypothetical protein
MLATTVGAALAVAASGGIGPGRGGWQTMNPGALGLDAAHLTAASTELHSAAAVRNCTLIVKSGYIIHEVYEGGSNAESTFESDSMGKATSAALIGLLEYRGLVDLDTPLSHYNVTSTQCSPPTTCPTWNSTGVDYFPNVTLRHVLSQATGYGRVEPGSFFTCESTPPGISAARWRRRLCPASSPRIWP